MSDRHADGGAQKIGKWPAGMWLVLWLVSFGIGLLSGGMVFNFALNEGFKLRYVPFSVPTLVIATALIAATALTTMVYEKRSELREADD